jgi:hypothetical protein
MTLALMERLLAMLVREQDREMLLGDLREELSKAPERAAELYARELVVALCGLPQRLARSLFEEKSMPSSGNATQRPIAFVLALGALGGALLITTSALTRRGPLIFVPYAALVVAGFAYLRVEQVRPFRLRFAMSLGSFMVATLIVYAFIGFVTARTALKIPLLGHAWRLGGMLLIGSILSGAVAQLSATKEPHPPR